MTLGEVIYYRRMPVTEMHTAGDWLRCSPGVT
jgi:hypothetical protein